MRALRRQDVDCTGLIMRQAGRYLPEYRATRTSGRFRRFAKRRNSLRSNAQPLERFDLDAAILFGDPDDTRCNGLGLSLARARARAFPARFERLRMLTL